MRRMLWYRLMVLSLALTVFTGCALFGRAPMEVLMYQQKTPLPHHRLLVMMRGLGGSQYSFEEEGLVSDVQVRGLPYDLAAPNAHPGYYLGETLVKHLKKDVIDPARAEGYDEIWLVGFSLGGLGSLLYLREHPQDIKGVVLVSPFLSLPFMLDEIQKAGGVRQWNPGEYVAAEDWQRALWDWLKTDVAQNPQPNIYLNYGSNDPYVKGQRLLASILPKNHVISIAGGHDYATFKHLWYGFLDSGVYTRHPRQIYSANK